MGPSATQRVRRERKDNAEKRRRQILDATLRSIVEHGMTRTTLATVASEAGLSQGVAVFYFDSKAELLTAALRDVYERYEANWMAALAAAGPDPADRLLAVVEADFDETVCNPDALAVWFAFWGELKATGRYGAIAAEFDGRRADAVRSICRAIVDGATTEVADRLAEWLDTLSDGYWVKLHLFQDFTRDEAREAMRSFVTRIMPRVSDGAVPTPALQGDAEC